MPPAKRMRQENSKEPTDTSVTSDSSLLEASTSAESMESEDSQQIDPELEDEMEQYRKPDASYIELIAKAIMESPGQKLRLQDIYDTLEKKYPYFQVADPGWRNSIRHNLSLHECFYKTEKCGNGKGHYWSIHPVHVQDFLSGDFRRRIIKSKARQLHQQQQQRLEVAESGALPSPTIQSPSSPSGLSPIGQTCFHFPSLFGAHQGPCSPTLPSSPSLLYSPTGGLFYTSFPFVYSGSYPLSVTAACSTSPQLLPGPTPMTSLPVPTRPPVLPPVCCINSPPNPPRPIASSDVVGTLTTPKSDIPHVACHSASMQETIIRPSLFSIDSILSSQ